MPTNFFYVYALKDSRESPALPFYIGKGAGTRAYDDLTTPDRTRKYARIREIMEAGSRPLVDILLDDLTESQALKMEAELIAAFGTLDSGGPLTNAVLPSGVISTEKPGLIVPHGSVERAQIGLQLLKTAIYDLAQANPSGIKNSDAAGALGLRSDYRGRQKDYLSYSVLGLLLREGPSASGYKIQTPSGARPLNSGLADRIYRVLNSVEVEDMNDGTPRDSGSSAEFVPPNAAQLINALRQIGYSFEQAIADLIDNCLNADASNVLVRVVHDGKAIHGLQIVDDGHGMNEGLLKHAMRFGAHEDARQKSLGKFGMGMKVASLSHAKTLSVYTASGAHHSGRRWTVERIAENWMLDQIPQPEIKKILNATYQGIKPAKHGTVVEWSRIDRLPLNKSGVDATIDKLFGRLRIHLGLHFHRFIETRRLAIQLDSQLSGDTVQERAVAVPALNPFKYEASGDPAYPMNFLVEIPGVGKVQAIAHIWPPNSTSADYKLGNRAAARQGLYFYRHDRLIQAGGWNGVVEHETEPHSSLARIAIDLPESLDVHFGLNIKKSRIDVPPPFVESLQSATAQDGTPFSKYRRTADQVYRKKDSRSRADLPLVPVGGLPSSIARRAKELIADGRKSRTVDVVWDDLSDQDMLFDVDRDAMCVRLDKRLRRKLLAGRRASAVDLPVVKLLFFFLLEHEFDKSRQSSQRTQQLQAISGLLHAALRAED